MHGPDQRAWSITRRPERPGLVGRLLPGPWVVVATAEDDEVRQWAVRSRRAAASTVTEVALALRTGAESPPGEIPPEDG